MRIAIMTGGGDCPGINAIVQAIHLRATEYGYEVFGVQDGYSGLLNGDLISLSIENVEGIFRTGGTVLGTSRTNPLKTKNGLQRILKTLQRFAIEALIVIGGDDTLGAANQLDKMGIPVIGVPKTIDNDLSVTDYCIGFQTAVDIAAQAIERIHTTAKSHRRVILVEIMGRYAGWLTLMAGLAGGAHVILIPEKPFDIKSICEVINNRQVDGKTYTIVAVAEGAKPKNLSDLVTASAERDEFGHVRLGGIAKLLEKEIRVRTGKETRSVVLGHVVRGGTPNSFDRVIGIRLGCFAVDLVKQKKFGYMAYLKGTEILPVKIEDVVGKSRLIEEDLLFLTHFFSKT